MLELQCVPPHPTLIIYNVTFLYLGHLAETYHALSISISDDIFFGHLVPSLNNTDCFASSIDRDKDCILKNRNYYLLDNIRQQAFIMCSCSVWVRNSETSSWMVRCL